MAGQQSRFQDEASSYMSEHLSLERRKVALLEEFNQLEARKVSALELIAHRSNVQESPSRRRALKENHAAASVAAEFSPNRVAW